MVSQLVVITIADGDEDHLDDDDDDDVIGEFTFL